MALRVGVIGGGLSGTLITMKLFQEFKNDLEVTLFERKPAQIFRGVAYSSGLEFQPLNVRAAHMNLWHDKPGDFYTWLEERWNNYFAARPEAHDFIRRDVFGDYVEETFMGSLGSSFKDQMLDIVFDEVNGIRQSSEDDLQLQASSLTKSFDYVILALGNFLPGDVTIPNLDFYRTPLYQSNPWDTSWIDSLDPEEPVLVLGSGLTAVDQVINLLRRSHKGKISILSRRGFLPRAHRDYKPGEVPSIHLPKDITTLELFRQVRRLIAESTWKGINWRNVIDVIRNQAPQIWSALSTEERKRFLRHVRPYWEVHRHRIPEASLFQLEENIRLGKIEVIAGRLNNIENDGHQAVARVQVRGSQRHRLLNVGKVVNCTGPQTDFRKIDQPLIQDMMGKGWLKPDELNLGLAVNEEGQLISCGGGIKENIFTIGSLRKGAMWECTALREIALQADQIVSKLKNGFSSLEG